MEEPWQVLLLYIIRFVEVVKLVKPTYISMIVPSRWFADGKGIDSFRSDMIGDKHISILHDFLNGIDVFNNVEIKGGICYFLRDSDIEWPCHVVTHENGRITKENIRFLKEGDSEVFIHHDEGVSIYLKVAEKRSKTFYTLTSTQKPFGLHTFVHGETAPFRGSIELYENGGVGYIDRNAIEKNEVWVIHPKYMSLVLIMPEIIIHIKL